MKKLVACLWLGLAFASSSAHAQECPPVPTLSSSDINVDTKLSLGAIKKIIASLDFNNQFQTKVRNVFIEHPEALQWYVVLIAYHDGCVVIRDDKSISSAERLTRLETLRKGTIPQFQLTPVATTKSPSPRKPGDKTSLMSPPPRAEQVALQSLVFVQANGSEVSKQTTDLTWADRYLRPVPVVVTKGNQYWVNVGYATKREEGERALSRFKQAHPNQDFALYRPFGRNDKWNIVMATWVSDQESMEVLAVARSIDPSSFRWRACSEIVKDRCTLNRKLQLAQELAK